MGVSLLYVVCLCVSPQLQPRPRGSVPDGCWVESCWSSKHTNEHEETQSGSGSPNTEPHGLSWAAADKEVWRPKAEQTATVVIDSELISMENICTYTYIFHIYIWTCCCNTIISQFRINKVHLSIYLSISRCNVVHSNRWLLNHNGIMRLVKVH